MNMLKLTVLVALACLVPAFTEAAYRRPRTEFRHPKPLFKPHPKPAGFKLVQEPTLVLDYHFGPVMTGHNDAIKLFVVFYGKFTGRQKAILRLFFRSFWYPKRQFPASHPTVEKWWEITREYRDLYNVPVARSLIFAGETSDSYSLGKNLNHHDIQKIVLASTKKFGADSRNMYLVLTSADVLVDGFCMDVCGSHFYATHSDASHSQMLAYGWIGNPATQCPEFCSWPYAPGGGLQKGLIPPNGDIGIDGMVITIGNILAGMATNPYGNAYYMGDATMPLEAAGACQGEYGAGAYPGYPGQLRVDNSTGASYNVFGARSSKFLLPWIWNPVNYQCSGQV